MTRRVKLLAVAAILCLADAGASAFAAPPSDGLRNAAVTDMPAQRKRARVRIYRQPAAWDYPRPGYYSYPGPNAVRQCADWYRTEYRASGAVVTPQMRCRWVPG